MTLTSLHRMAAGALMASGLLLGYSYISHPHHMSPNMIASAWWIAIHCLFLVSLIAGMIGTVGFYLKTAERTGVLGLSSFLLAFLGLVMISGLDYYEVFIAPHLAAEFPEVIQKHGPGDKMGSVAVAFPLSGAITVLGYFGLAIANLRIGAMSRGAMYALLTSAILFGIGLSPLGGLMIARIGALFFGLSLIWSGIAYWREDGSAETHAHTASSVG